MNSTPTDTISDFSNLTPDTVINAVEEVLGVRCSNLCRPLNSYINRVYEDKGREGRGFATTDCWCRESCVEFRL